MRRKEPKVRTFIDPPEGYRGETRRLFVAERQRAPAHMKFSGTGGGHLQSVRRNTLSETSQFIMDEPDHDAMYQQLGIPATLSFPPCNLAYTRHQKELSLKHGNKPYLRIELRQLDDYNIADEVTETFVHISISGESRGVVPRVPVSLVILLDTSASMRGKKLHDAKNGTLAAMAALEPGDRCTVITFNSRSCITVPPFTKDSDVGREKESVGNIQRLKAGGQTDMKGGLKLAAHEARRAYSSERNNQILLLSDGQPDKEEGLVDIAVFNREMGVKLTTLGVGLDFNENLLMQLADKGGGSYFFIENESVLKTFFAKQVTRMKNVAGKDVVIFLYPKFDVTIVDVPGFKCQIFKDHTVVHCGDVTVDEELQLVVNVKYELCEGEHELLEVVVTYQDVENSQVLNSQSLTAVFGHKANTKVEDTFNVVVDKVQKVTTASVLRQVAQLVMEAKIKEGKRMLLQQAELLEQKTGSVCQLLGNELREMANNLTNSEDSVKYLIKKGKLRARELEMY